MTELIFLLFPIAMVYGWYMGARSVRHQKQERSEQFSRQFIESLNFLLSDQSDKAIDILIDLLEIDSESIETHLTLSNLFRSRGEVDRAMILHQNLIARTNLTIDQRHLALQELAKDYMVAGFIDRSEKIFESLRHEQDYSIYALGQLLLIHQQTKEWQKAIDVAFELIKLGKTKLKINVAHYYCEIAQYELDKNKLVPAQKLLKKSLQIDKKCVRASFILANLAIDQQQYKDAINHLENIAQQDIDFISDALPLLQQCYQELNEQTSERWFLFLQKCLDLKAGATSEAMFAETLLKNDDYEVAQVYLTKQLYANPTMKGFYSLMGYHARAIKDPQAQNSLLSLQNLVAEQLSVKPKYQCRKCGFTSRLIYWQCPSCQSWGLIKPIRGLDGE